MSKPYRVEYSFQTPTGILIEGRMILQAFGKKNAKATLLAAYKHTKDFNITSVKKELN